MDFAELKVSDLEEIHLPSEPSYQTRPKTSGSQQGSLLSVPSSSYGRSLSGTTSPSQKSNERGSNKNSTATAGRDVASAWSRSTSSLFDTKYFDNYQ